MNRKVYGRKECGDRLGYDGEQRKELIRIYQGVGEVGKGWNPVCEVIKGEYRKVQNGLIHREWKYG